MKVKCNKCDYVADQSEFRTGLDFFQKQYIKACPKCDNRQSPGDASMRMFGGERPFSFVRGPEPDVKGSTAQDALATVLHRAEEAS